MNTIANWKNCVIIVLCSILGGFLMYSYLMPLMLSADQTNAAAGQGQGDMGFSVAYSVVMFVILMALMYFVMIRPQRKKEKEAKEMRDSLQIGDEVTTIGGITGIIVRKTEDTVVIETGGDRSKIRVKIWAISENATIHDTTEEAVKKK